MAGIYVHVPFCKSKCYYCDFYSIVDQSIKESYLKALKNEVKIRKNFFNDKEYIETLYIGGGTPSILSIKEIEEITDVIFNNFKINKNYEFTIEVNPDDVNREYMENLIKLGINRISIGIQTLNNKILKIINRRHDREISLRALDIIFAAGFQNVSVDLIYGLPYQTIRDIENDIIELLKFPLKHISAYSLIIEDGTYIKELVNFKKVELPDEEQIVEQYKKIIDILKNRNFIHYEISNFAMEGFYSIHNSNYWKQEKYIGLGPSAHSYDKEFRYMNFSDLEKYINNINNNQIFFEQERLTLSDKYNEYILTGLRTMWGISLTKVVKDYNQYYKILIEAIKKYSKYIKIIDNDIIHLTEEGFFISDRIISECFAI